MPPHALTFFAVISLAILSACTGVSRAAGPSQHDTREAALNCSSTKLADYAAAISEPADLVAKAAFQACRGLWEAYIDAQCRDTGICDPPFRIQLLAAQERGWINQAMSLVVEWRAKPSGSPPTAAKAVGPSIKTGQFADAFLKETNPFSDAWVRCTKAATRKYASSAEPAETIVVAVFGACRGKEEELRLAMLRAKMPPARTAELIAQTREIAREHIISDVLAIRAKTNG